MVNRYNDIVIKNNRKIYTPYVKGIKNYPIKEIIITKRGDRLDILAKRFYNNEYLWWIIALYNGINKPSVILDEGIELKIPEI